MPAKLLAIPATISQLEQLDRDLLTHRDIEQLFGGGKPSSSGNQRTLPRTRIDPLQGL